MSKWRTVTFLAIPACCAFGVYTIPVEAEPTNASDATLRCISPVFQHSNATVPVEVTLNGQQYTGNGITFSVYPRNVRIDALSPASGPSFGATSIVLTGGPYLHGTDHRCRFTGSGPPTGDGHAAVPGAHR